MPEPGTTKKTYIASFSDIYPEFYYSAYPNTRIVRQTGLF